MKKEKFLNKSAALSLILILNALISFAQTAEQSYSKAYNLDFTIKPDSSVMYPWLGNAAYSLYTMPFEVKHIDRGLFANMYFKGDPYIDRLKSEQQQRIVLPKNNLKLADIEFEYKCENIARVSLIVDAIDMRERIVDSDTTIFRPDINLSSTTTSIKLDGAEMINVTINAEGVANESAHIAYSKLNIMLDGKPIDSYPVRLIPSKLPSKKINYIPIDDNIELKEIDAFNDNRIIAIGESIHGNSSVKSFVYNTIVKAVEEQNTKLILLEMPMEKSLSYNRYIQGANFMLDSASLAYPYIASLLNGLKDYNSSQDVSSKVKLLGIDYSSTSTQTSGAAINLFDFFSKINGTDKVKEVDQLSLLVWDREWDKAIEYLENNRDKVATIIHKYEVDCLLHIMNVSKRSFDSGIKRNIDRDCIMYVNTKFLIDKFLTDETSKAIIYSHAAHINPVSTFPAVPCAPFGSYMRSEYGNDYFPTLVAIGNGHTVAYDGGWNRKDTLLMEAPEGSLEYFLNTTINESIAYVPITKDFDKLLLSRFKGSHHIAQEFFPFNLYHRYDGVFFIKEDIGDNIEKVEITYEQMFEKHIQEIKQRELKVEEMRSRLGVGKVE